MNLRSLSAAAVLSLVVTSAAITGCGRAAPLQDGDAVRQAEAGQSVSLIFGETIRLGSDGPLITFRTVHEDSRCPVDVICVWVGDAHIGLEVASGSEPPAMLSVHSALEPRHAVVAGYRLLLTEVAPARREQDRPRPADYSIRLAISRG